MINKNKLERILDEEQIKNDFPGEYQIFKRIDEESSTPEVCEDPYEPIYNGGLTMDIAKETDQDLSIGYGYN